MELTARFAEYQTYYIPHEPPKGSHVEYVTLMGDTRKKNHQGGDEGLTFANRSTFGSVECRCLADVAHLSEIGKVATDGRILKILAKSITLADGTPGYQVAKVEVLYDGGFRDIAIAAVGVAVTFAFAAIIFNTDVLFNIDLG